MEELILMRFWLSIAPLLVKGFTSPNSQCLNSCDATCGIRTANGRRRNRRQSLAGFPLSLWCHLLRQLRDVNKVDVGHGRSARRHWVSGGNVPDREECSNVVVLKTTYDVWFWDILSCFTKKKKGGGAEIILDKTVIIEYCKWQAGILFTGNIRYTLKLAHSSIYGNTIFFIHVKNGGKKGR